MCGNRCPLIRPSCEWVLGGSLNHSRLAWRGSHAVAPGSPSVWWGREGLNIRGLEWWGGRGVKFQEGRILWTNWFADRQTPLSNVQLISIYRFFPRFENGNIASRSPLSLVKPRPKQEPLCVISQQRFRPPGLIAQCSLYGVCWLKGSSVLLFCSNLIPTLFKHQGFHTLNTECLLECVRKGAGGGNRWMDQTCSQKSRYSYGKVAILSFHLQTYSKYLLKPE